jgi:hypothetical protein
MVGKGPACLDHRHRASVAEHTVRVGRQRMLRLDDSPHQLLRSVALASRVWVSFFEFDERQYEGLRYR